MVNSEHDETHLSSIPHGASCVPRVPAVAVAGTGSVPALRVAWNEYVALIGGAILTCQSNKCDHF